MTLITAKVPSFSWDVERYGKNIDINNPENLTEPIINGFISWSMEEYKRREFRDKALWEAFGEDFEGWTKQIFDKANKYCIRELRDLLRENGVYVRKEKLVSITNELVNVINELEPHEWTAEQIKEQMRDKFNSRFSSLAIPSGSLLDQRYQRQKSKSSQDMIQNTMKRESGYQGQPGDQEQTPEYKTYQTRELPETLPISNSIGLYGRELGYLAKIYESEQKYSGGIDSFDLKITIFYDLCRKSGVPPDSYQDAFSIMLRGKARDYYYDKVISRGYNFETMTVMVKDHFETSERRQAMLTKWNSISLSRTIRQNQNKPLIDCFESMLEDLQNIQRGLSIEYHSENTLRDRLVNACQGVKACAFACFKPAYKFEALCDDIRSSIANYGSLIENESNDQVFFTDRRYNTNKQYRDQSYSTSNDKNKYTKKKCFVCRKVGCWSTKHTEDERQEATNGFKRSISKNVQQYIVEYEGLEENFNEDDENDENQLNQIEEFVLDITSMHDKGNPDLDNCYLTSFGAVNGINMLTTLDNSATQHALTKLRPQDEYPTNNNTGERYNSIKFEGIMIDTGAARWSTAGHSQYIALKMIQPDIKLDKSTSGNAKIKFGIGSTSSIGTIRVNSPIGTMTFHVVAAETPFLLCLRDMDTLRVKFDNLENVLIQENRKVPVIRKYGHPFILLDNLETTLVHSFTNVLDIDECHLTDVELRQLHRRFGHPSVHRFVRVLERSGHDFDIKAIKQLTKFCHACQLHSKSPGRFKFVLRDDSDFNHAIYVDVMYISGQPLLHVVDEGTRFGAARWLKDMTAQHTWDALRACWIDVYVGPPDMVIHDAGSNFASSLFRQNVASMSIVVKEVPVEAHQSIGIVERYHAPLRRAYEVISTELKETGITKDIALQMAVKAVNDTAGPDGIVPTLLVFGAYPRMSNLDPPALSTLQRATAIKSAMKEVRRLHALRDVKDALRTRNGPRTENLHNLPINSNVLVWRENEKAWTGPYKLLSIDGESCTIDMPHGPVKFRTTIVKPYYRDVAPENQRNISTDDDEFVSENENRIEKNLSNEFGPDRELTSNHDENFDSQKLQDPQKRYPHRHRMPPARLRDEKVTIYLDKSPVTTVYISNKEILDGELSKELRAQGIIKTIGKPFQKSREQEVDGLIMKGVFEFVPYDPSTMKGTRLFKSRFVDEIKGKATSCPFEKSRLVIQAYNDKEKNSILTQSPTIQRVSQRIILCLAASLTSTCKLYLRDVSQAYVQSNTSLNRLIIAKPPIELSDSLPSNTVMKIKKPLYGIAEAGTHWFSTYQNHHRIKLFMAPSTFDPCLLVSQNTQIFGIVGLQTDDTLFIGNEAFAKTESEKLQEANIQAKPIEILTPNHPLLFNGCKISSFKDGITIVPKNQGDRLNLINTTLPIKQAYIEQRARGAYIASVCQPEATFDLSVAAQHQEPNIDDAKTLNKRLKWQIANKNRGIHYVPIELKAAKLIVFVDSSFANNSDFSSQIGFVIVIANESENILPNEKSARTSKIRGNIVHWSSVKCKRVTRSVLASELYAMVHGIDIAIAINSTLNMIMKQLGLNNIPLIICTDSFSLYECMVKLGTTREKRLMIDIMAVRESYERRELSEIRWISGDDNPADAMTKQSPVNALKNLIDSNELMIKVKGWVDRE